ncbi:MAG: AAC(3) family N-acetyltransferase [Anaerolineaceae bacterium]|nr:AAC(3) family N-acetyltransferase [Anaerolineaceae bacterium]
MAVTKNDIIAGLTTLGVASGNKVLVHSSLSSFGHVEGGADTVIDAILDVIGEDGTMLVPTLTGHEGLSADNPPIFDPTHTPCWTGTIPESFRKRPCAVRSCHPTHSVAAIGSDASHLTEGHQFSITPCDALSPYGKLAKLKDSFILLVGVTHESSTMFHHIEEIIGADYHMQRGLVKAKMIVDGVESERHIMLHRYGTPRNFNVMEQVFIEQGIQKTITIGNSEIRLVKVVEMVRTTVCALRADKTILCE